MFLSFNVSKNVIHSNRTKQLTTTTIINHNKPTPAHNINSHNSPPARCDLIYNEVHSLESIPIIGPPASPKKRKKMIYKRRYRVWNMNVLIIPNNNYQISRHARKHPSSIKSRPHYKKRSE